MPSRTNIWLSTTSQPNNLRKFHQTPGTYPEGTPKHKYKGISFIHETKYWYHPITIEPGIKQMKKNDVEFLYDKKMIK